jgi:hypothetical protein
MKTILSVFLCLMISAATFAANIDGTWIGNVKGPDGNEMPLTYVFKMDGDKLTGSVQSPGGEIVITNTKVEEKSFSFEISFNEMVLKNQCTFKDDDTIILKMVDSPMGDGELILKREKK